VSGTLRAFKHALFFYPDGAAASPSRNKVKCLNIVRSDLPMLASKVLANLFLKLTMKFRLTMKNGRSEM
jgi:hypothetical protein